MNAQIYINNRIKLTKKLADASAIVIVGNSLTERNGDTSYAFRQDSSLLYFSGCNVPRSYLLIDCTSYKSYIIVPKRSKIEKIFDDESDYNKIIKLSGVQDVLDQKNALQIIKNLSKKGKLYTNFANSIKNNGVFSNPFKYYIQQSYKRQHLEFNNANSAIAELRVIKQPYEIDAIQKAVKITKKVLNNVSPEVGQSEKDIENIISSHFYASNVVHAYEPIVAFGKNASVLHHHASYSSKYMPNQSLLYDVGAEYHGYSADISRSYGQDDKTIRIIKAVTNVQDQLIKWLAIGKTWKALQELSVQLLMQEATRLNLLSKNQSINNIFPHAIGHYLGLEVHDVGDYKQPFAENMVITVEPGLYSRQQGYGVRVEDDVLITNNGAKVL